MKKISVHPNAESLIDDSDFGFLSTHKWYLSNGYAKSAIGRRKMHRLILGAKVGEMREVGSKTTDQRQVQIIRKV